MTDSRFGQVRKSRLVIAGLLAGVVMITTGSALAGGFALREQSSIGQGASFAGVAAGGALSSMFWNPATLTQVEGVNVESVLTGVVPYSEIKNLSPSAPYAGLSNPGDVGLDALVPSSYSAAQLSDDLFVGLSINAPFGMATKAQNPSMTSFHAATAKIFTTDVKVNVAYRVTDAFSVGFGAGATYGKVRMTATPGFGAHELQGDAWAPVFSLGATYKPFDSTTIGIGYRSQTRLGLSGTEYSSVFGTGPITADLNLPASVTVGLRQKITDRFTMLAGLEWTQWSSVKDPIPIIGSVNLLSPTVLDLGYEDSWFASIGGEYAFNENLTLRAGVGFEDSPIPTSHRNLRLPDADRLWLSAGASYDVSDKLSLDLGYSHLFIKDNVAVSGSNLTGSYTGNVDSRVDIFSVSMRYQWHPKPVLGDDGLF